ncbi:MAG: purine-nucleoside phosphorylase [Spirochaetaceae bacterium]|nr:purine-nucleoside phosphorylase [Spirochaetaceae bacterium]
MTYLKQKLQESAAYIKNIIGESEIHIAIILGSGLGNLADKIENAIFIPYKDIPNFPLSTAPGHVGRLVIGTLSNKKVLCFQGRFHFYEGYDMATIVFPIQVLKFLNINNLLITNAAGGINTNFNVGDLMLITDHIKLTSENPLRGINPSFLGPRFFDMSYTYDRELIDLTKKIAKEQNLDLKEGVYHYLTGPSFETPAEIRMARLVGGDAVGMSTVPEAIAAVHMGIKVLGISCITNMAAGILEQPLTTEEVIKTGESVKLKFTALVSTIVERWN